MSRFFVDSNNIDGKYVYINDREDIKHMTKVLRAVVGDSIDISDCREWEYKTRIEEITQDEIRLTILDKQKFAREPKLRVTLYQGIPKASKMEIIIQKCVEAGVHNIVPVFMDRTVVVDNGNFSKKLARWQKISDEAVKQCKRGIIPKIEKECTHKEMLRQLASYDLILFPYENEENITIKDCLTKLDRQGISKVAIIIGPEGGFSDKEAEEIDMAGGKRVSLGKTILRTETAGLVALAMTMYELEL